MAEGGTITYIGGKLFEKQAEIAQKIIRSGAMYHVIVTSRQFGKSYLCKQLLLWYSINNKDWQCCYVSMTYAQANKVFKEILNAIKDSGIIRSYNRKENSIILINGSEIYFKSYQNADAIRGYSFDFMIVDEAAYIKEEDWNACFRPTLNVRGKKCILCSTPKGKNFFWHLYRMGYDHSVTHYRAYSATWRDNPYSNVEEIEDAKKVLPKNIYLSEYECKFIDGAMSVFQGFPECVGKKLAGGPVVAGIDVGRQQDYTVLTIMNGANVVYVGRWNNDTWEHIIQNIIQELKKYRPATVTVEVNGVGDVFFEDFTRAVRAAGVSVKINPWTTTNTSKAQIVERLASDFATGSISIPDDKDLVFELENFEAAYSTASRAIKYGARSGLHDDMVMSLAITNYSRTKAANYGKYTFA